MKAPSNYILQILLVLTCGTELHADEPYSHQTESAYPWGTCLCQISYSSGLICFDSISPSPFWEAIPNNPGISTNTCSAVGCRRTGSFCKMGDPAGTSKCQRICEERFDFSDVPRTVATVDRCVLDSLSQCTFGVVASEESVITGICWNTSAEPLRELCERIEYY